VTLPKELDLEKLQHLIDRTDILDCIHRYTRGMDRLDREMVRSAFHDDAVDDHGGGFVGPIDDFVDWAFSYHASQVRHQHYVSNHTVEISNSTAHSETYYLFVGTDQSSGSPLFITGGRYIDRFEKRQGRWGIITRNCLVEWMTNWPKDLPDEAVEFLKLHGTVARNKSDTSYDRPLQIDPSLLAAQ
jgi:hypothetical protein